MPSTPRLTQLASLLAAVLLMLGVTAVSARAISEDIPTLTSADEPGEPLTVTGIVFHADGKTPAAGATIYVYQADARGYYSETTTEAANPRLKATFKTDAEGRYTFRTIKPGGYPGTGIPAHIHYRISAEGRAEERVDLQFVGDPRLSERAIERSRRSGRFGTIQPLEGNAEEGWSCVRDIRLGAE